MALWEIIKCFKIISDFFFIILMNKTNKKTTHKTIKLQQQKHQAKQNKQQQNTSPPLSPIPHSPFQCLLSKTTILWSQFS